MEALKIQGLRKTYAGGTEALKGIDLSVEEGDFYALLGANGAGKTTLINIAVGLVVKTGGTLSVFGHDLDQDPDGVKEQIGIVPQEFNFNIFEKVFDIVETQAGYYGMSRKDAEERTAEVLKDVGLWEKRDEPSMRLSGGMKRRLMIARALVHRPKLLILDEPTAGVDVELRRGMWDYLKKLNAGGTTILLTTHYLEEVEQLCRNMAIIQKGLVVKRGAVSTLLAEADGKRFKVTVSKVPTDDQVKAVVGEDVKGDVITVSLNNGEGLDVLVSRFQDAGLSIQDISHAHNRLEELYLATLSS